MNDLSSLAEIFSKNNLSLILLHSIKPTGNKEAMCSCGAPSCPAPGKHPCTRASWKFAKPKPKEKMLADLSRTDVNFAIATGRKNLVNQKYLTVIDIDDKEHPWLKELFSVETFCYKTGSGGWHFWFWSDIPWKNSVGKLCEHVDVRGVNGYVVVPPSKHISGSDYGSVLYQNDIKPIPDFIVKSNTCKDKIKSPHRKQPKEPNLNLVSPRMSGFSYLLTGMSVPAIKKLLRESGGSKKIPIGVRNTTIHRMLSSDRAQGLEVPKLLERANEYRKFCEDWESITDSEISAIASQVSKYQPRYTAVSDSSQYQNVTKNFYKALCKKKNKKGVTISLTEDDVKRMEKLDDSFFASLEKLSSGDVKSQGVSLSEISFQRNMILGMSFASHSKYPDALLAAKLKSLGFSRLRTAKKNLWNIKLPLLNKQFINKKKCVNVNPSQAEKEHCLQMTMKIQDREFTIKNNKHPSAPRYPGRCNQELGSAFTKMISLLAPGEFELLAKRCLILDEDGTAKDFDAVLPKDRVGIALEFDEGFVSTMMDVSKIENDMIFGTDVFTKDEVSFSFEEASVARAMGYFEILYRPDADGKMIPHGVDTELKVKVKIYEEEEQDPNAQPTQPVPNVPSVPVITGTTNAEAVKTLMDIQQKAVEEEKAATVTQMPVATPPSAVEKAEPAKKSSKKSATKAKKKAALVKNNKRSLGKKKTKSRSK